MDPHAVGDAVNHLDAFGGLAAAAHRQILEGGVGGDDRSPPSRRRGARTTMQRFIEKALVLVLDDEQFRADVVLVVDEPLAKQLERRRDEEDQVRRIACLDDREAALAIDLDQQARLMKQRGRIFAQIGGRPAPFGRQRMPVDRDVVDDFERRRELGVRRADHRDAPPRAGQRGRLLPDPPVERDRKVFDDDDAGPGFSDMKGFSQVG